LTADRAFSPDHPFVSRQDDAVECFAGFDPAFEFAA
jgi:hypothetical protein